MRQNARFNFRMESNVKEALEELAKSYSLSSAAYLRVLILREQAYTAPTPELHRKLLSILRNEYVNSKCD